MNAILSKLRELEIQGLVTPDALPSLKPVADRYAIAITPEMAALIDRTDPSDPIARQFVPTMDELKTTDGERADPIGDDAHAPVAGIVHRHRDRVLLKAVAACPVYCRFCFRRETVGSGGENALSAGQLETAFDYIAAHPEIWEVILTGGDPFVLSARRARELTRRLAAIPHVKVVRWHTRVPVVDPSRVTDEFAQAIRAAGLTTFVAIHANHPREFNKSARAAIARLIDAGMALVSQSVLLRGVNDSVDTLEALMRAFVELRIKPYYLHHPDLAPGTSHFRVSIAEGLELMRQLRQRLSGLALPTYVLDVPGGYAKVPLESTNVEQIGAGRYRIRDHDGRWHAYPQ